jgi:purine nucleoside permease
MNATPPYPRRRFGHCILGSLAVALTLAAVACSQPAPAKTPVHVLVITMFDVETAPWLAHESLPSTVAVPGLPAPLRCATSGLCVATVGEGKSNAAASVAAILDDPALDLRGAYFLTAGIAGASPQVGTLGFAAWARWLVDWDLGHHVPPASAPDVPHGYLPFDDQHTNVFRLNEALVTRAYQLSKDVPLTDSPEAAENRTHYPGQAGRKPFTTICDTLSGDDYWTGAEPSATAQYITDIWTKGQGKYCTTQMEDNATATVLARHGRLDHYLSLRTASDFDQPYQGQTVRDALSKYPGGQIAADNAYLVGAPVAHYLLTHPDATH